MIEKKKKRNSPSFLANEILLRITVFAPPSFPENTQQTEAGLFMAAVQTRQLSFIIDLSRFPV